MMSARVVFNLEESDALFDPQNKTPYREHMNDLRDEPLDIGPSFNMARFLLRLNRLSTDGAAPVELQVIAKDDQDTIQRIVNSLEHHGLNAEWLRFTSGRGITRAHHNSFGTDFFLSRNAGDVQQTTNMGIAAVQMLFPSGMTYQALDKDTFDWWTDGDAVAMGDSAEYVYRQSNGIEDYLAHEFNYRALPIEQGPHTALLKKISALNKVYEDQGAGTPPVTIHLLTARGGKALSRALETASHHGIWFNGGGEALGGVSKAEVIKHFQADGTADFFADDQLSHSGPIAALGIASGVVPYKEGSKMFAYIQEQRAGAAVLAAKPF